MMDMGNTLDKLRDKTINELNALLEATQTGIEEEKNKIAKFELSIYNYTEMKNEALEKYKKLDHLEGMILITFTSRQLKG